jgi:nucleotide-binding universal stress UspA family protein
MKPKPALKCDTSAALAEHSDPATTEAEGLNPRPGLKKILVPIDFSNCSLRALNFAIMLAEPFRATVILLHILEPGGFGLEYLTTPAEREDQLQLHLQAEREKLFALNHKRIGHRLPSETLVRVGRAWSEIPDTAKALAADLIVLGAHGESSFKNSALGSTAEGVVRHARCPVLTVG